MLHRNHTHLTLWNMCMYGRWSAMLQNTCGLQPGRLTFDHTGNRDFPSGVLLLCRHFLRFCIWLLCSLYIIKPGLEKIGISGKLLDGKFWFCDILLFSLATDQCLGLLVKMLRVRDENVEGHTRKCWESYVKMLRDVEDHRRKCLGLG